VKKKEASQKPSSSNYFLRKVYRKLSNYKPSPTLFAVILTGAAIFLLAGGVYDIVLAQNPPYPYPYWIFWPTQRGIEFFLPGRLQEDLLGGSIIIMILYSLGTLGLLMAYRSVKYTRDPRQAAILLFIGVIFLLLAFFFTESILYNNKLSS